MTREKASNIWQIIKAYGEGKEFQYIDNREKGNVWQKADFERKFLSLISLYQDGVISFRIKPEENYTIEQNCGENRVEGGVLSVSGSVSEKHTCKECVGETVFKGKKAYCKNRNCDLPACDNFKPKEKHYRPFKDCNELIREWNKKTEPNVRKDYSMQLPVIWIKDKDGEYMVTGFYPKYRRVEIESCGLTMERLFETCTFLDGSPCGVMEE